MEQLDKRYYNKEELALITGAKLSDTKHFKRNVENKLIKWGYGYDWIHGKGVTITHVPESPEARLQEILIRQFHVDIQVDMYAFACFVTAFTDVKGFFCMPWACRAEEYHKYSGVYVCEKTLSNWCKTLIEQEVMSKGCVESYWRTDVIDFHKIRTIVTKEEAQDYFNRRSSLVDQKTEEYIRAGLGIDAARKAAWKAAYEILWSEFRCCYYSCKTFSFNAWNLQGELAEVYELTREISRKAGEKENA